MARLRPILRPSPSLLLIWVGRTRFICPPRSSNIRLIGQCVDILALALVNGVFVVVDGGVVVHDAVGFLGLKRWRGDGTLRHFGYCCEDPGLSNIGGGVTIEGKLEVLVCVKRLSLFIYCIYAVIPS